MSDKYKCDYCKKFSKESGLSSSYPEESFICNECIEKLNKGELKEKISKL